MISYPCSQHRAILPAQDYPLPLHHYSQGTHIINPLLANLVQSRWWNIGCFLMPSYMYFKNMQVSTCKCCSNPQPHALQVGCLNPLSEPADSVLKLYCSPFIKQSVIHSSRRVTIILIQVCLYFFSHHFISHDASIATFDPFTSHTVIQKLNSLRCETKNMLKRHD